MSEVFASSKMTLIVGVGATGLSVARYLRSLGERFCFADERATPAALQTVREQFPDVNIIEGPFQVADWQGVSEIVLSPGVPRKHPQIAQAIADNIPVVGDIELFCRAAEAPIIAITGSNGKSTVTSLVGEMAKACSIHVAVGGNLGTPALDLLSPQVQLYVLELSSFQLESTVSLAAQVATVLNISQDHMDRYSGLSEYFLVKQSIYHRAKNIVVNKDDPLTHPPIAEGVRVGYFGSSTPDLKSFGLVREDQEQWLAMGLERLVQAKQLRLRGKHNLVNVLAALAVGRLADFDLQTMLQTAINFAGLPHRCSLVREIDGVEYINDSKATNVGACIAAIDGLSQGKNILLIAGGDGKGADFSELLPSLETSVKRIFVLGRDAEQIEKVSRSVVEVERVADLSQAVHMASQLAEPGDVVLLSPACASLDMFTNYQQRGEQFESCVEALCQR